MFTLGLWNKVWVVEVDNLDSEEAKNYYRIETNLNRNEYSKEVRATLVAELIRLEPLVRKGKNGKLAENGKGDKTENSSVLKGRGNKSPAMQLAEKLGYSKPTMQSRFKEWALISGYQGPMSSVEGEEGENKPKVERTTKGKNLPL